MININNAEMKELTKVDGIGKVIALNIVNYRKRNNGFNELKELKNIKGIADKTYSLIEGENGIWTNKFNLKPGTEYKIMYDSTSWEEDKYIGDNDDNFKVSY
jgi:competence ComEA-like helix-hairpin-helix protein